MNYVKLSSSILETNELFSELVLKIKHKIKYKDSLNLF